MTRVEKKVEIKASSKTVYDILEDSIQYPKWNLVVNESIEIKDEKLLMDTKLGEITVKHKEVVPYEILTDTHEGGPFSSMGEIITRKNEGVEVTLWYDVKKDEHAKQLENSEDFLAKSLKTYAEYLENGGKPEKYDKKAILITH